ncbi:apoptosis-enhancing nuclease-like isoform 2-T2 [Anomaloglossus baeobatrachus]|uniref:apoptosis-enhancing nuclease-like n=1 Tax=Anomaloglossus baeobatrachus TaxID=238106 RepID=UPI003F50C3EC
MNSSSSTGLFHGFPQSTDSMEVPQTDKPRREPKDIRVRSRRKSRKHQRFLLRKAFLQDRGLLQKYRSEEHLCSFHGEGSFPSCPRRDEVGQPMRLDGSKAPHAAIPVKATLLSVHSLACDYDSGMSMDGSTPSSRASSPTSWLSLEKCVAIDCEMVGTGPGGKISELARCSVVNHLGEVLYDKYVKPELPVTDYRTRWSGITRKHLRNAVTFKMAHKEILQLLKGKRVIGHAIDHDFSVLKYFHPTKQTRDTSKITLLKQMAGLPQRPSASLKRLALLILQKRIQVGSEGHSSVEDAQTCMELYKLVAEQVEQDLLIRCQLSDSNVDEDSAADEQYMEDQYWPPDLNEDCK